MYMYMLYICYIYICYINTYKKRLDETVRRDAFVCRGRGGARNTRATIVGANKTWMTLVGANNS